MVPFTWKGREYKARQGETIASALFAQGVRTFGHHHRDGSPQGKTAFWSEPLLTPGPAGEENWSGIPLFPPELVSCHIPHQVPSQISAYPRSFCLPLSPFLSRKFQYICHQQQLFSP